MLKILVVEDDESISNLISVSLKKEGYSCTCASTGSCAADLLENDYFDLVLLDILLPDFNGYELLEYIRPTRIPVIFVTAKGQVEERIKGLRLGADDYIVKPFQIGELIARVEAIMRRMGKGSNEYKVLDVIINISAHTAIKAGMNIELTVKEFDLLVELIRNKNVALYRDRLYETVWGEPFTGETRTLDSHIQRLRKKLGWEQQIQTVFRIGYRLEV